jgi:hypothetical protein
LGPEGICEKVQLPLLQYPMLQQRLKHLLNLLLLLLSGRAAAAAAWPPLLLPLELALYVLLAAGD